MNELAVKEIENEITTSQHQALALAVINNETYSLAGEYLTLHKQLEKKIKIYFNGADGKSGIKPKAYATWKGICDAENIEIEKLKPAINHLNKQMTAWNIEQEKIRKAEEDRLRLEATKREEEERLQAAIQAEAEGAKEEAEAILNEPAFVPPPIVEKSVPKQAGLAMATTWRWKLKDINLVPRQYLQVNEVAVNQVVKALKDKANIAGIETYPDSNMRGVRQ